MKNCFGYIYRFLTFRVDSSIIIHKLNESVRETEERNLNLLN